MHKKGVCVCDCVTFPLLSILAESEKIHHTLNSYSVHILKMPAVKPPPLAWTAVSCPHSFLFAFDMFWRLPWVSLIFHFCPRETSLHFWHVSLLCLPAKCSVKRPIQFHSDFYLVCYPKVPHAFQCNCSGISPLLALLCSQAHLAQVKENSSPSYQSRPILNPKLCCIFVIQKSNQLYFYILMNGNSWKEWSPYSEIFGMSVL